MVVFVDVRGVDSNSRQYGHIRCGNIVKVGRRKLMCDRC